jgi:hypothetical protein
MQNARRRTTGGSKGGVGSAGCAPLRGGCDCVPWEAGPLPAPPSAAPGVGWCVVVCVCDGSFEWVLACPATQRARVWELRVCDAGAALRGAQAGSCRRARAGAPPPGRPRRAKGISAAAGQGGAAGLGSQGQKGAQSKLGGERDAGWGPVAAGQAGPAGAAAGNRPGRAAPRLGRWEPLAPLDVPCPRAPGRLRAPRLGPCTCGGGGGGAGRVRGQRARGRGARRPGRAPGRRRRAAGRGRRELLSGARARGRERRRARRGRIRVRVRVCARAWARACAL